MSPSSLQVVHIANVLAYVANAAVTFGVGASDRFPSNGELSAKYQTLVTPSGYAFSIWGLIFISELIFTIAQLLPAYRSTDTVIGGIGYNFVIACIAQCAWTFAFTFERVPLSFLAMVGILIPLVKSIYNFANINESLASYWLLQFPLELHGAWIMAATLVNLNVVWVYWGVSGSAQITSAYVSLLALLMVASWYTFRRRLVIPSVLAWAALAISVELSNPRQSIVDIFADSSIHALKLTSQLVGFGVLVLMILVKVVDIVKNNEGSGSDSIRGLTDEGYLPAEEDDGI